MLLSEYIWPKMYLFQSCNFPVSRFEMLRRNSFFKVHRYSDKKDNFLKNAFGDFVTLERSLENYFRNVKNSL